MNRPSFALTILLAALGGPLFIAGVARSENLDHKPVCTPPVTAVHPVDIYDCPLPCPGYVDEYGAAEADGLATAEDWQDFACTGEEKSLAQTISDQYDDLFDTLKDAASQAFAAIESARPAVVEADPSAYNADAPSVPKYEPYAEESADTVENNAAPAEPVSENSSVEAYESAFSGYGSTGYLQENYGYQPVKEFDLDKLVAARRLTASKVLFYLVDRVIELEVVADARQLADEAHSMAQQLSCEYPFERLADASEAAWDHIEEYQRLSARKPVVVAENPAVLAENEIQGYRLPFDDCGWDGEYNWRRSLAVPAQPATPAVQATTQRDALLTLARSLRNLAGQLDAASAWIAEMGGIDVAELGQSRAAR